jgi:ubiquitin-protein ligase
MSCKRTKRILKEFQELENSRKILEESGIYFEIQEENINVLHFMIVGPKDTPYENGFYFFSFEYPDNYPMSPPIGKYMTQGTLKTHKNSDVKVRFNPNLYTNGKVCLSMLWRATLLRVQLLTCRGA